MDRKPEIEPVYRILVVIVVLLFLYNEVYMPVKDHFWRKSIIKQSVNASIISWKSINKYSVGKFDYLALNGELRDTDTAGVDVLLINGHPWCVKLPDEDYFYFDGRYGEEIQETIYGRLVGVKQVRYQDDYSNFDTDDYVTVLMPYVESEFVNGKNSDSD